MAGLKFRYIARYRLSILKYHLFDLNIQYWRSFIIAKLRGCLLVKYNNIHFRVNPLFDHFRFWMQFNEGNYDQETFYIFDKFLRKEYNYVDIGAWIGPTVLYCSQLVNKVIAFEPDPVAFNQLNKNIFINKLSNVELNNYALTSRSGNVIMSSFGGKIGDSMTSQLSHNRSKRFNNRSKRISVECKSWIDFSKNINYKIDFIKIDIEGGEFELVPAMVEYLEKHKPIIYLSLHAPFLDKSSRLDQMKNLITSIKPSYSQILNAELNPIGYEDLLTSDYTDHFAVVVLKN